MIEQLATAWTSVKQLDTYKGLVLTRATPLVVFVILAKAEFDYTKVAAFK